MQSCRKCYSLIYREFERLLRAWHYATLLITHGLSGPPCLFVKKKGDKGDEGGKASSAVPGKREAVLRTSSAPSPPRVSRVCSAVGRAGLGSLMRMQLMVQRRPETRGVLALGP